MRKRQCLKFTKIYSFTIYEGKPIKTIFKCSAHTSVSMQLQGKLRG